MVVAGVTKKKLYWACFALVLTILFLYTTEPEDTLEENTGGDRTFEELVRKWSEERSSMVSSITEKYARRFKNRVTKKLFPSELKFLLTILKFFVSNTTTKQ